MAAFCYAKATYILFRQGNLAYLRYFFIGLGISLILRLLYILPGVGTPNTCRLIHIIKQYLIEFQSKSSYICNVLSRPR